MSVMLEQDGWALHRANDEDIDALMSWFQNATDVNVWGGPSFRYPYTRESFYKDCHWPEMDSFSMRDPDGRYCGFGQLYNRNQKINLARLIAQPGRRRQGVGRRLVSMLMAVGPELFPLDEFSLLVLRDNIAALECYRSLGFEIRDFPADQVLADKCYFLTRPVRV